MKNVRQILLLVSTFAFSLTTDAQNSIDLYAKNNSYSTNCAEIDNVSVPIFSTVTQQSGKATYLELKATHPSYIGSIKTFSGCPEDFSGSDCQTSQTNATPTPFPGIGWETLKDRKGNTIAYCKMLFDDHINRFDICRTPETWWRNRDMTVSIGQSSETGSYVKVIKKISDANSWPEVMVLYEDGNLRFKPHPPITNNLLDVCYGSSVIVGPAPEDTTRPFVDIDQVTIDTSNLCLDISYLNSGSAHLCLAAVDRTEARIIVKPNYGITTPLATFRSMWVSDGNADVDRIKSGDNVYPILDAWDRLDGSNFSFSRSTESIHNPEAPDIAIKFLANGDPVDSDSDGNPDSVELQEGTNPDVKDNDVFANARLFVMQQYRDFLKREGDAEGIQYWEQQLASGQIDRAVVADSFLSSPEFEGRVAPIVRLYLAYLPRTPDYDGLWYWVEQLSAGAPLSEITQKIYDSIFRAQVWLDCEEFVTEIYHSVLEREPDARGLEYWTGRCDADMSRANIMLAFAESPEFKGKVGNQVLVVMMYAGMLQRAPEPDGYNYWLERLENGLSRRDLINNFINAPEYRQRFLP